MISNNNKKIKTLIIMNIRLHISLLIVFNNTYAKDTNVILDNTIIL